MSKGIMYPYFFDNHRGQTVTISIFPQHFCMSTEIAGFDMTAAFHGKTLFWFGDILWSTRSDISDIFRRYLSNIPMKTNLLHCSTERRYSDSKIPSSLCSCVFLKYMPQIRGMSTSQFRTLYYEKQIPYFIDR